MRALTRRERAIPALPAVVLYFAGDGARCSALDPAAWRLPRAPSLAQGLGSLPRVQRMKAAGSERWLRLVGQPVPVLKWRLADC